LTRLRSYEVGAWGRQTPPMTQHRAPGKPRSGTPGRGPVSSCHPACFFFFFFFLPRWLSPPNLGLPAPSPGPGRLIFPPRRSRGTWAGHINRGPARPRGMDRDRADTLRSSDIGTKLRRIVPGHTDWLGWPPAAPAGPGLRGGGDPVRMPRRPAERPIEGCFFFVCIFCWFVVFFCFFFCVFICCDVCFGLFCFLWVWAR